MPAKKRTAPKPGKTRPAPERLAPKLGRRTVALQAHLSALPGATGTPMTAATGKVPLVVLYKVRGKVFAILSVRAEEFVLLKCDPDLADLMRRRYQSVGHRTHLDRRFWISVALDGDVPPAEVKHLIAHSYAQVCAKLTRKQKAAKA
jgi:predicted DNA-binding protein (MmcQ/YjbR family)